MRSHLSVFSQPSHLVKVLILIHSSMCRYSQYWRLALWSPPEKQVAQLRQRPHAAWDVFVHRYSQNHAQNCIFGPPYVRIGGNVSGLFDSFNAKNFVAEFLRENASFTRKTGNWHFWATLRGAGLRGNVCNSSLAGWKARSRLPIGYN